MAITNENEVQVYFLFVLVLSFEIAFIYKLFGVVLFKQVWNLEFRQLFCSSQWETNLTAFAVVPGTSFMCVVIKSSTFLHAFLLLSVS